MKSIAKRARLADEANEKQQATNRQLSKESGACGPYRIVDGGIVFDKPKGDDIVTVPLTNFVARIVEDISEDDGCEIRRVFRIKAELGGAEHVFLVSAHDFGFMAWPTEHLGAGGAVFAGGQARWGLGAAIVAAAKMFLRRAFLGRPTPEFLADPQPLMYQGFTAMEDRRQADSCPPAQI